jgi:hypothetical protein
MKNRTFLASFSSSSVPKLPQAVLPAFQLLKLTSMLSISAGTTPLCVIPLACHPGHTCFLSDIRDYYDLNDFLALFSSTCCSTSPILERGVEESRDCGGVFTKDLETKCRSTMSSKKSSLQTKFREYVDSTLSRQRVRVTHMGWLYD